MLPSPSPRVSRALSAPVILAVLSAALGGCTSFGSGSAGGAPSTGSTLANYFKFGTPTPPEPAAPMIQEDIECPTVDVLDGAAALRQGGPSAEAVRYQLSIVDTARECRLSGDQIVIKVGVEGRALIGPAGSPGTYSAPVRIVAKRGDKVLFSKLVRQQVSIPSGAGNAPFVVVEDNIVVPKQGEELSLLVGFDEHGREAAPTPRKRRKAASAAE